MKKLLSIALCICLTLAAVFTAVPSFAKAEEPVDGTSEAQTLLSDYYNEGEYIKRTDIYAETLGVGDEDNFHARASAASRKTVYSDGNTKLVMTTDPNSLEGTGYMDDPVKGYVVHFTTDANGNETPGFGVPQYKTIKDWFTDLAEFAEPEYTWTKNGNVYTTTSNLDKWVEFIAPMWKPKEKIMIPTRVTMQNTIEGLTLTLYGNVGEAVDTEFAKAKITVPVNGWQLVTDASTLKADDQIVIVAKNTDYALSTNQKTNNRGAIAFAKSGNTVTFGEDVQKITLEDGTVDGTFAFNTGSGYLYAASSSGNQLKTKTSLDDNGSWKITIADGTATIVAQGTNTRNVMQYNPNNGSPLFACYESASQQALAIYAFASEGIICNHINKEVAETPATCTEAGVKKTTCLDCGNISTEEIPATGHTFVDGVCSCGATESTPDPEPTPTWEKATSIAAGDTIVIVCGSKSMELSGISTTSTKYGLGTAYTNTPAGVYILTVEAGSSAGTFAFKAPNGQYLYWGSGNSLTTDATKSANTSWTVTFDDNGNATIKNAKDTSRMLRWNASSPRFACYTSSQTAIQIYKKSN